MSHLQEASLGEGCIVGPFARLRPGTVLADGARVGNFVETKKASIGAGSKVNHLTYIGDCEMGPDVNIGAGTITCNYDGVNKHKTGIGSGVFVGSNSTLVAPSRSQTRALWPLALRSPKPLAEDELAVRRGKTAQYQGWNARRKKEQRTNYVWHCGRRCAA